jgi:hypothetical protein
VTRVGDFELITQLASGGMAETHVARSVIDGSVAVIKLLLPRYVGNAEFIEMFVDEGRVISALRHPNVVEVRQFGFHHEVPFLAMEYLHGVDLRTLTRTIALRRKSRMPVDIALFIASAMCAGLHHAHEARTIDGKPMEITHRDVSPQNVMLTFDGLVKLIDFGIATARGKAHETRSGALKGKVPYMAPEQVRAGVTDRRTDVYATGVVLYEMLAGQRPYITGREKVGEFSLMMAIVNHDVVPLASLRPELAASLVRVVERAMALEPAQRYATCAELHTALRDVAHELGVTPAQGTLHALLVEVLGPRAPRAAAYTAQEVADLVSEVEIAKTATADDPAADDEPGPSTVGEPRAPTAPPDDHGPATIHGAPSFDDVQADRASDRAIDKVVRADRTVLRLRATVPPSFRWGRLFEGVEGNVELDFTGAVLTPRSVGAIASALRALGDEVTAIDLVAAPLGLLADLDARGTVRTVTVRGGCEACATTVASVITLDDLRARTAACPRCGGRLGELDLTAMPAGFPAAPAPELEPESEPEPEPDPIAVVPALAPRWPWIAGALGAGIAAALLAWGLRGGAAPADPTLPAGSGRAVTWREGNRWIVEVPCEGRDAADTATRCHVRALHALIAEIEDELPPRIRALRGDRVATAPLAQLDAPLPGRLALARTRLETTAGSHKAVARFEVPVVELAGAVEHYATVKAAWGAELVNAPPSRPPGVLVLTAGKALAVGDRLVSAGGLALESLDALTPELLARELELIIEHQERRRLAVRGGG